MLTGLLLLYNVKISCLMLFSIKKRWLSTYKPHLTQTHAFKQNAIMGTTVNILCVYFFFMHYLNKRFHNLGIKERARFFRQ